MLGLIGVLLTAPGLAQEAANVPVAPAVSATAVSFSVEGNSLLPESSLQAILLPLSAPVSLEAIQETANRLQQAYRAAGYGAVVVNLPEQTVSDGVVRLRVVEGKLDDIYVQGNRHFSERNILLSLPSLKTGVTPDLLAVDANALQANENPAKSVRIVFQSGQSPGLVDALVVATDRKPTQFTVGADNTGNNATGRYRTSIAYQDANLFERDHILGLRAEVSPSQDAQSNAGSLSYLLPLYGSVAAIEFSASYSDVESKAIATAAGDALFAGKGAAAGVRYRRYLPKFGLLRQRLQIGFDLRQYQNTCSVGVLGPAGCGNAGADVDVRPITVAYDARSDSLSGNLQFSANAFPGGGNGQQADFDIARPGAKARYSLVRGSLATRSLIGAGISINLRNSFQYTRNALVSSEQIGQGGLDSVRGYQERELSGDSGATSSLELFSPTITLPDFLRAKRPQQLNGLLFGDVGRVANNRGSFCGRQGDSCSIAGIGGGLRWSYANQIFLRTELARAMKSAAQTRDGDYRLHFSFVWGF